MIRENATINLLGIEPREMHQTENSSGASPAADSNQFWRIFAFLQTLKYPLDPDTLHTAYTAHSPLAISHKSFNQLTMTKSNKCII